MAKANGDEHGRRGRVTSTLRDRRSRRSVLGAGAPEPRRSVRASCSCGPWPIAALASPLSFGRQGASTTLKARFLARRWGQTPPLPRDDLLDVLALGVPGRRACRAPLLYCDLRLPLLSLGLCPAPAAAAPAAAACMQWRLKRRKRQLRRSRGSLRPQLVPTWAVQRPATLTLGLQPRPARATVAAPLAPLLPRTPSAAAQLLRAVSDTARPCGTDGGYRSAAAPRAHCRRPPRWHLLWLSWRVPSPQRRRTETRAPAPSSKAYAGALLQHPASALRRLRPQLPRSRDRARTATRPSRVTLQRRSLFANHHWTHGAP